MIISCTNHEQLILENIISTISQIRLGGQATAPLIIPSQDSIQVDFYVDAAKTVLLFSENSTDNAANFVSSQDKTLYYPPDLKMNHTEDALSVNYSQPLYYVDVIVDEYTTIEMTYNNRQNMLFQSVIVSTKKDPSFTTNDNSAIIVPAGTEEIPHEFMHFTNVIPQWDIYTQLTSPNLTDLSEMDKVNLGYQVTNILRLALYKDPYRKSICTFYDNQLIGTLVEQATVMPSTGMFFKGNNRVKCCYTANATSF